MLVGRKGGSFALLADEDGTDDVQPWEGTERGVAMEEESGGELEDYVDE